MTPGERKRNPPRPEQPRGGEQHPGPPRTEAAPKDGLPPQTWEPLSAATPPGLGAASAVLPMTTRGQARLCISLLGSGLDCEGRPQDAAAPRGRLGHPAPQPRAPAAAAAHGGHVCCLLGDVASSSGKRTAREEQHAGQER